MPDLKPDTVIPAPDGRTFHPLHDDVVLQRIDLRRGGSLADNLSADADPALVLRCDAGREHRERTVNAPVFSRVIAVGRGTANGKAPGRRPMDLSVVPGALVVTAALVGRGVTNWGDEARFVVTERDILAVIGDPSAVGV